MGKKDNTFFQVIFDVLSTEDGSALEGYENSPPRRSFKMSVQVNTFDWLMSILKSFGYELTGDIEKDINRLDPFDKEAFNFEGKEFVAECSDKEYNGKNFEDWNVQRGPRAASRSEIDALLKRLKEEKLQEELKDAGEEIPF